MKDHYRHTWFESARSDVATAFAIITAHNPLGSSCTAGQNAAADQQLEQQLRELGMEPFRVIGYSPDRSHAEAGWGAAMSLDDAVRIGRAFQQDAIYWVENGNLHLVCLQTLESEALCPWQQRLQPLALPYFTLHLGSSPPDFILGEEDEARLRGQVLQFFKGFTMQRASGCFLGGAEDVLLISIATHEIGKLLELAALLRREWSQKGVGLHACGHYVRVTEVSDLQLLREVLAGLASSKLGGT